VTAERETSHFPVFLDVSGRLCVVVGGGPVAERKARALAECGADVAVITAQVSEELLEAESREVLGVEQRGYVRGDLAGAFLAVCLDPSEEVCRAVAAEAHECGCLVNVAGMPELCTFIMPSVVRRGGLQVALSTGGASPEAARQARAVVADALGDEWAAYVVLMAEVRELVAARGGGSAEARELLGRAAGADVLARLAAGEIVTARSLLAELDSEHEAGTDGEAS
jgi:precorrin-2 dehydrogenase/sirohydrochlorin ferrochelatase